MIEKNARFSEDAEQFETPQNATWKNEKFNEPKWLKCFESELTLI